ncbi:MAG: dimethylarginine dimethylaminohydrolase family protein [Bacteroidota bacterium]
MIELGIYDETAPLESVILGTAESFGGTPELENTNDPKSVEHILDGTFPKESDLIHELETTRQVFEKYGVKVYRPEVIENYNQIFSRDVGLVIGDQIIIPVIAHNRRQEVKGIQYIIDQCDPNKVLKPLENERMEGGDVMPWKGKIFVGYSEKEDFDEYITARTNLAGLEYLEKTFPDWKVYGFELKKSDTDPRENSLHLDCCFQPIGHNHAIIYPEGFKHRQDAEFLINMFGEENVIRITKEEMYNMNSNVFSISPEVIVSERNFKRLNSVLRSKGFTVEEVPYAEASKMEGLLRCSTLPLKRRYG